MLKILLVVVLLAAGAVWFFVLQPYGPTSEMFVDIAPGTGTEAMAAQLHSVGVIRSAYAFEAMKVIHGGLLKAGEYRFDHAAPLAEVYARLRKGDVYTRTLVIPEGYNLFEIAQAVQTAGLGRNVGGVAGFLAAEKQHVELITSVAPGASSLEGYLFPDTYKFSRHATALEMLSIMVRRFRQKTDQMGITAKDVTMASLVEREVHLDSERPMVASVFVNRLAAGMPLQTDPAVVYASMLRGTWTGVIHQSELHSDSPYNTYTHTGLPPGPICNPSLAALKAAMQPAQSDYLYFVADANGATKFARTIEEHKANVAGYRAAIGAAPPVLNQPPPREMQPEPPSMLQVAPVADKRVVRKPRVVKKRRR